MYLKKCCLDDSVNFQWYLATIDAAEVGFKRKGCSNSKFLQRGIQIVSGFPFEFGDRNLKGFEDLIEENSKRNCIILIKAYMDSHFLAVLDIEKFKQFRASQIFQHPQKSETLTWQNDEHENFAVNIGHDKYLVLKYESCKKFKKKDIFTSSAS
jgi:hypothetical protein